MGNKLNGLGSGSFRFNELMFFLSVTSLTRQNQGITFSRLKFPPNLTSIDTYLSVWLCAQIYDFPPTLTSLASPFWLRLQGDKIFIFRSETPPTPGSNYFANGKDKVKKIYVPSAYMTAYQNHETWGQFTSKMIQLEGSKYEVFNEWDYD